MQLIFEIFEKIKKKAFLSELNDFLCFNFIKILKLIKIQLQIIRRNGNSITFCVTKPSRLKIMKNFENIPTIYKQ